MIGSLEKTVIDCPDPLALAQFSCQVLCMTVNENFDGWVVRARKNLDRHPNYILAAYMASGT